jgi:CarD family transcriptional regulator
LSWRCRFLGLNENNGHGAKRLSDWNVQVVCRVIGDQSVQHPKESNRDMSLDGQTAKSDYLPEATDTASAPSAGHAHGNLSLEFKTTECVVYPAHGAGQIRSIEKQTIAGASLEFFVIYFTKSKMTVRVPVQKAASLGMRKLSDISAVQEAKRVLREAPRKNRGNWSRLAQEYESKINSGNIVAIAEAARDLFRPGESEQSFSERQLYVSALHRLCGEIALVEGISEEESIKEIEGLLKTGTPKRSA